MTGRSPLARRLARLLSLLALSTLLTYSPELFCAVSGAQPAPAPQRTLLRIALSSADAEAADALLDKLSYYNSDHPSLHLRVTRHSPVQLCALPAPLPDMIFCPPDVPFPDGYEEPRRLSGGIRLCALLLESAPPPARSLIDALCEGF